MEKVLIWTKQHKNILNVLEDEGRYIAKKEYIENKFDTIAPFYLDIYSWYTERASKICKKPKDVNYPIWVSLSNDERLDNDEDTVVLEIEINKSQMITIDFDKWGYIANYLYIPIDEKDESVHQKLLDSYNVDDPTAYMSNFYPQIKSKIIKSWDRLFEETAFSSKFNIGTIWEVKKEWVKNVIK